MKVIDIKCISHFVELQTQLVFAFTDLYPDATDFKWLIDFPQNGIVQTNNESWRFIKHGMGLRFTRISREPHIIIDIHNYFNEPRIVDEWRLYQYFESCGKHVTKEQLSLLIYDMCSSMRMIEQGGGLYLLSG